MVQPSKRNAALAEYHTKGKVHMAFHLIQLKQQEYEVSLSTCQKAACHERRNEHNTQVSPKK